MITATKPSPSDAGHDVLDMVAGTPPVLCKAECEPCERTGLLLVPVLEGVARKEFEGELQKAGYAFPTTLDAEGFSRMAREGSVPVVRALRRGHLTVMYPGEQRADVWQTTDAGLCRKILHQVDIGQYARHQQRFQTGVHPKACSRGAANVAGSMIDISGASRCTEAWVVFTAHLLAPSVFEGFMTNRVGTKAMPDGTLVMKPMRQLYGRTLHPSATLGGGLDPHTFPINESSLRTIADFVENPGTRFKQAFDLCAKPLDGQRAGLGAQFASTVRFIERANGIRSGNQERYLNTSRILALDDDLGICADLCAFLLAANEAKKLWSIGGEGLQQKADPTRIWAVRSSLHLDMALAWEREAAARQITESTRDVMERRYGASVTLEQFKAREAQGGYPPGTTFEPHYEKATPADRKAGNVDPTGEHRLDANGGLMPLMAPSLTQANAHTPRGRVRLPDERIKAVADTHGAGRAEGMRGRLESRVDLKAVKAFRAAYQEESERWDQRIGGLERDRLAWRNGPHFQTAFLNLFEHGIDLVDPNPALGTLDQQVADYFARLQVIDHAVGGGAITLDGARDLARLYRQPAGDPLAWFGHALCFKVFNLVDDVWKDAGNNAEANESAVALRALSAKVRESLHKHRQQYRLEESLNSILAARSQMVNLVAASVDESTARALGLGRISEQEAQMAYRVHVKVGLLAEELVTLPHEARLKQRFVFNMAVPTGLALDEMRNAMNDGVLPMKFTDKTGTTRQSRRLTERQFSNLTGRLQGQMHYPVLLDRRMLDELEAKALLQGDGLVELVPDAYLGLSSKPFKVPEHVARRLVRERVVSLRQAMTETGEGRILGSILGLQFWALHSTGRKIADEQGIEQADAVLSTISTALGMMETGFTMQLHALTMRADGARTLRADLAKNLAKARLWAGMFGAASTGVDAALAFVRMKHASKMGDRRAGDAYLAASITYSLSGTASLFGSILTYASFVARGSVLGLGVPTAALMGAWLMGAGIVLAVVAFGFMLYALHVKFHPLDVFLDRSYWGLGQRAEGKFGQVTREQLQVILNNRQLPADTKFRNLQSLVREGMKAEVDALNVLPAGLQVELEWNDNWVGHENLGLKKPPQSLVFKITAGRWPAQNHLDLSVDLYTAAGAPAQRVHQQAALLSGTERNDDNLLEFKYEWVFQDGSHLKYQLARVSYVLWGENRGDVLARDVLNVTRD